MTKEMNALYVSPEVEIIEMEEQSIICDSQSGNTDQYNFGGFVDGWE